MKKAGIILDRACVAETGNEVVLGKDMKSGACFSSALLAMIFLSRDKSMNCYNHYERKEIIIIKERFEYGLVRKI